MLKASYILVSAKPVEYLSKALSALSPIKRDNEEFVVVYAGSDDCLELKTANPWIDQWIIEKDQGEAHGVNKGILATHGAVIRILTDDDEFNVPVFHEAIDLCLQDDVDAVFVGGKSQDDNGLEWVHPGDLESVLNFKNTCGLSLCFRRSIIPLVGLPDTRYISTDIEFICRIICSGVEIKAIDKIGFVRWHNQNSNAIKFKNKTVSERKLSVLCNSNLSIGNNTISSSMINDILDNQDYARWLGTYIDKGIMHFSCFESGQSLLSEKIMEIEKHLIKAKDALAKKNTKTAESNLHCVLETASELPDAFSNLINDLYSIKCRINISKENLSEVERSLSQTLVNDTQNPDLMSRLGDVCLDAQHYKDAALYFKLTILKKPDDLSAYLGLALASKQLNDEETYKMACKKTQELDPSKSELINFK